MIISKLTGGLGNQMFQFAAAKALSLKLNTDLILDCTNFKVEKDGLTNRNFGLSIFEKQPFQFLSASEKKTLLSEEVSSFGKVLNLMKGKKSCSFYRQPSFRFDENFFSTADLTYLIGYFQSEKFFSDYSNEIRSAFDFQPEISDQNSELLNQIQNTNSVSVHVRRGDYVKVASNLKYHGVCTETYYKKAFEQICEQVEKPTFYFFSDDIDWVKENLKIAHTTHYITHNTGEQSFEDMRLMSNCKHHIIANSSFSWWGAWLNQSPDKIVISPTPWFSDSDREKDANDLIPKGWLKVAKA